MIEYKEIKKQIPEYEGFMRFENDNVFFLKKEKETKTGWFRAIECCVKASEYNNKTAWKDKRNFYKQVVGFFNGVNYHTHHLDTFVNNAYTEKGTSPFKAEIKKWLSSVNKNREYKVQLGVDQDSLYVLGQEYIISYFGILVGVVHHKYIEFGGEEWYFTKLIDKTPSYNIRNKKKVYCSGFKEMCKILEEKIKMIEKRVMPDNYTPDIKYEVTLDKKFIEKFDPKIQDSIYRKKPLAFEKKIIEAVGNKFYLERLHSSKNTAIIKTKNDKNFIGVFTNEYMYDEKVVIKVVIGFAMGNTDGRELFRVSFKDCSVKTLKTCINKAMKFVKTIGGIK